MTTPSDVDDRLDRVRTSVLRTLGALSVPPTRFSVRLADVVFELEWTDAPAGAVTGEEPAESAVDRPTIHSPSVGTFYRAPKPGAEPFLREGDEVRPGQQVGIVEAMKLMMPVEADVAGRVAVVLKSDGDPVEYGEALFVLEPLDNR